MAKMKIRPYHDKVEPEVKLVRLCPSIGDNGGSHPALSAIRQSRAGQLLQLPRN